MGFVRSAIVPSITNSNYEAVVVNAAVATNISIEVSGNYFIIGRGFAGKGSIPSSTDVPCEVVVNKNDVMLDPLLYETYTSYNSYGENVGYRARDRVAVYFIYCDVGDIITETTGRNISIYRLKA